MTDMNKYRIIELGERGCTRWVDAYMILYMDNAILFMDDNSHVLHTAPIDKVIIIKER